MILQALHRYYQRLLTRKEPGLAPFGYSPEKISYEILLALDGSVVGVNDIRDTSGKKPVPRILNVPQPPKRASNISPCFLWDKTSYVLGVSGASKRTHQEHAAFKRLHEDSLVGADDAGLQALLAFLATWIPNRFESYFKKEMLDANVVFRLEGDEAGGKPRYLHERPAAQAIRAKILESQEEDALQGFCLVTGEYTTLARLHASIKGVKDSQTNGASIVSFNDDAYLSYYGTLNKENAAKKENNTGANAPVSVQAAFSYTTILNHLLRRGEHNRQRLQIGDATVVFWAEADDIREAEAAELLFAELLNPPMDDTQETEKLRRVLEGVAHGRPLCDLNPLLHEDTRMFVLGLAPNASRLSIRFWWSDTLEVLARRLAKHELDMRLEPTPWRVAPAAWQLARVTAPSRWNERTKQYIQKAEDVSPQLAGEIMRAILSGGRYPGSLLANVIMRMRADGDLSGMRVAICKGVLARDRRVGVNVNNEEVSVSLNRQSTNPGYRLGRLFAVLESAQRNALGGQINATIRDRYYGAASATPASVFPLLLRNTQNHLGRMRKEKPGLAVTLERDIREIIDGLVEQFPRSLRLEDQGRFAIGYYHQSQVRFAKGESPHASDITDSNSDTETSGVAA